MKHLGMIVQVFIFVSALILVGVVTVFRLDGFSAEKSTPILNGKWVSKFETYLDDHLAIKQWGVNVWAALEFTVFDEGRKGVVVGDDQWLFTDEEFFESTGSRAFLQGNLQFISEIDKQLLSQNVDLVVVLVPAKADVYHQHLKNTRPSNFMLQHFDTVAEKLEKLGPKVVDLRDVFLVQKDIDTDPLFFRTDTHWTVKGAKLAADTIAKRVEEISIDVSAKRFVSEVVSREDYLGDLARFIPIQPHFSSLMPAPDILTRTVTTEVGSTASDNTVVDLFGDQEAGVVLVGTSYSANKNWNFEGALKDSLSADIINFATEGEGPFVPMQAYLGSQDFAEAPPKLLIWEIPIRYLVNDYTALNIFATR